MKPPHPNKAYLPVLMEWLLLWADLSFSKKIRPFSENILLIN